MERLAILQCVILMWALDVATRCARHINQRSVLEERVGVQADRPFAGYQLLALRGRPSGILMFCLKPVSPDCVGLCCSHKLNILNKVPLTKMDDAKEQGPRKTSPQGGLITSDRPATDHIDPVDLSLVNSR